MIPFYRSLVIHKDLYNVHGGFVGWTYEHLGIFSFTNELWNNDQLLGRPDPPPRGRPWPGPSARPTRRTSSSPTTGSCSARQFVPWKPVKHPLYGDIEVGGFVKQSQRVPPPFLIEELCHRNAAFVVYHADQMPRRRLGRGRGRAARPATSSPSPRRSGTPGRSPASPQQAAAPQDRPARHPEPLRRRA